MMEMKSTLLGVALVLLGCSVGSAQDQGRLENSVIAWRWDLSAGKLNSTLEARAGGASLKLSSECFQVMLDDGRTLKASDFKLAAPARTEALPVEPDAPTLSRHFAGQQMVLEFSDRRDHLTAVWSARLREGSAYLRQVLTLWATGKDVWVKEIVLFDQRMPGAERQGLVDGSPIVADPFFCGYEHPMAQNTVAGDARVQCRLVRNAVLKDGESLTQGLVLGVAPAGQMRRGFLAYLERERAHPYRPFLHYNSWFDIAWDTRKYNACECLDAVRRMGQELAVKRGVKLDSFLFDDGWDDNRTLWRFHDGFPDGFAPIHKAAAEYGAGIGVWLSPFGGYNHAKEQRLRYGCLQGFETNANGFSLAGPIYYHRFHDICLDMVRQYGVNQFKFDGLAAGAKASQDGLARDGDGMMRLIGDLREAKPDIYINQTTGTWPSPFWLLYVDSTWRGGADHDFRGQGSPRQQWITYRDWQTYQNVVQRGPLYPLNSLMLHGIICAGNALKLEKTEDRDFTDEVHAFFGSGTQLQELYLTPSSLNQHNWDDLAEAAKWSRANANVLVDTHWIGGDPGKGQVYGWASWSSRKGILVLRNPCDKPTSFTADAGALFQLPEGAASSFTASSPWKKDRGRAPIELRAGEPHTFALQPFEVVVLETGNGSEWSDAGH
jgi:hypothetical protein